MRLIGLAILAGFAGTLAAAAWTFVLGLGGAPGALLWAKAADPEKRRRISPLSLLLTVLGQSYVSVAFVAFVVQSAKSIVGDETGFGKWLFWVVAWWVAGALAWMALKDSAQAETKNVQHYAATFTAPISNCAFFLFVFFPSAASWGWGGFPIFDVAFRLQSVGA